MKSISNHLARLDAIGIPREDSALGLPLGMETTIVCKHNLRNLIDMSHQRMCSRAYHEFREPLNKSSSAGRRIFCPTRAVLKAGNTQSIPPLSELSAETKSSAASSCRFNQSFLRHLFSDICAALSAYSEQWEYVVSHYFMPKCRAVGYCAEKHSCGLMPAEK